jgi:exosortase/archaeosortase family protein
MVPERSVLIRRGFGLVATAALLLLLTHAPPLATLRMRAIPEATAEVAGRVLSMVAMSNYRSGSAIYGQSFTMLVTEAETLDYLYPLALSIALFWPASAARRGLAALLSMPAVLLLAVLRIVNIFIIGSTDRARAVVFHNYVWPVLLLVLGGFVWLRWCHAAQGSAGKTTPAGPPSPP